MTKKNCLLIAVLLISLSANAQQEKHNNVVYLGLGSYMISQNKIDTYFDINPGVKFEYIISRWMIFTSYSFDLTPQYDHLYHNINVGLGYLF